MVWSGDLTDVTLAVEDANSKLVDIVAFADADIALCVYP